MKINYERADRSILETIPNPGIESVKMHSKEFTSLCPKSGLPDFGEVYIEYEPNAFCLESKSLKYYLLSYRQLSGFCEMECNWIFRDIMHVIHPKWLSVRVLHTYRGGISIEARREGRDEN